MDLDSFLFSILSNISKELFVCEKEVLFIFESFFKFFGFLEDLFSDLESYFLEELVLLLF